MIWLMQDECKPLSVWLSTRLGDYREIRGVASIAGGVIGIAAGTLIVLWRGK